MKEVFIKNNDIKKTNVVYDDDKELELVKDALKRFGYSIFQGSLLRSGLFGRIGVDFRAIIVVGECMDDEFDIEFFKLDLSELDSKFEFGYFDITQMNDKFDTCWLAKLNEEEILKSVLVEIGDFDGRCGYVAKGAFVGNSADDLRFIGVRGDISNESIIRQISLEKLLKSNDDKEINDV